MRLNSLSVALLLGVLAACGTGDEPENPVPQVEIVTAESLGEQTVLTNRAYLATSPYAEASRDNGKKQAQLCKACHSLEKGGANMIGPNINGFFGKSVGTAEGFDYSNAVLDADFAWTPRALDAWLVQPSRFLPGNKMTFAGVSNAEDRADLIAYLLQATDAE